MQCITIQRHLLVNSNQIKNIIMSTFMVQKVSISRSIIEKKFLAVQNLDLEVSFIIIVVLKVGKHSQNY